MSSQQAGLANQLRPVAQKLSQHRSFIRPIAQLYGELADTPNIEILRQIRYESLRWMQRKTGANFPATAWEGAAFELDHIGAQPRSVVTLNQNGTNCWIARADDACTEVAGRRWVTELAVISNSERAFISVRLTCVWQGEEVKFTAVLPRIWRDLCHLGLLDAGQRFTERPRIINSQIKAHQLIDFILNTDRKRPIIVISLADGQESLSAAVIDVTKLARECIGLAHVALLYPEQSWILTQELGKDFSVFGAAVRTYNPRFDLETDSQARHPLALPRTIENFKGGCEAFFDMLVSNVVKTSVRYETLFEEFPSFSSIKQKVLLLNQDQLRTENLLPGDKINRLEQQIVEVNSQISLVREDNAQLYGWLEQEQAETVLIQATAADLKRDLHDRDARIASLEDALKRSGREDKVPIPKKLDDLETWSRTYLTGKIFIHQRALNGAKKSNFEDPELIFKALLLLAIEYRNMRLYGEREAFQEKRRELYLDDEPPGASEYGEEYCVNYNGENRDFERHLKFGNSRDTRHCLRIYYFWDSEMGQVVVGWLPTHLTTRNS